MGMKNLASIRNLYRAPALLHKWEIEIPTWPKAVAPANKDITFFVTTSGLPAITVSNAEVELGGYKMTFNGKEDRNGEITWELFENVDRLITKYFVIDYHNKRQNHSDPANINMVSSPEEDLLVPIINMKLYDASSTKVISTYKLINCKFEVEDIGGSLGQEAEILKPSIKVSYDSFVVL